MSVGTINPTTFEWIILDFQRILQCGGMFIRSPDFHLPDSSWYLLLQFCSKDWIAINLWREDNGASKSITYTIKINGKTGVREHTYTKYFGENGYSTELNILKSDLTSDLLITCYINCNISHPIAGKEFLTCAVQTEAANSGIEKEDPKDEDWTSIDKKGIALLTDRMKRLLMKGDDHDLTICVQNKEFRAHRTILRSRSPVFAMMLSNDTKENSTSEINIEDCDPETFDEFLLYVYSGRTENLTPSNALRLYYTADKYDFPVLKEKCVSLLKSSLSVESIFDIVLLAAKHQEKELLEVATEFFARNMKKIVLTVEWQKFMIQYPVEANELINKSMQILQPEN